MCPQLGNSHHVVMLYGVLHLGIKTTTELGPSRIFICKLAFRATDRTRVLAHTVSGMYYMFTFSVFLVLLTSYFCFV